MADNNDRITNSVNVSGENSGIVAKDIYGDVNVYHEKEKNRGYSIIPLVIEKLSEITNIDEEDLERQFRVNVSELKEYKIPDKIEYNKVIVYKEIIDEYCEYSSICEYAFNTLDNNNIGIKRRILEYIKLLYRKEKGNLLRKNPNLQPMDIIRENSDYIIELITSRLTQEILLDKKGMTLIREDIYIALSRIICYAFIKCKILEKPRYDI